MDEMHAETNLVLLDYPEDGIARLTLNRPDARNALNTALRQELAAKLESLEGMPSVRCVLLRGNQDCFAAGADLKEIVDMTPAQVADLRVLEFWQRISRFKKPIIAVVAGKALGGGCELAQHADLILAGRSARFGQPEVNVGIMPGGGATQRLARTLGYWRAMQIMLAGEPLTGEEAAAIGLASEVVDDDHLEERSLELARLIASRPPLAVQRIKEVVQAGLNASLSTGLQLERRAFELLFDTRDQKEGMRAFIERRAPAFTGR